MTIIKCVAIMISESILHHPLLFLEKEKRKKRKERTVITYLVFYPSTSQCNDQENLFLYKHIYLSLNSKLHPPTLTYFQISHLSFFFFLILKLNMILV